MRGQCRGEEKTSAISLHPRDTKCRHPGNLPENVARASSAIYQTVLVPTPVPTGVQSFEEQAKRLAND